MTNTEIYRKVVWKINHQLKGFYVPRLMIDREILDDCEIYYNIFSHDFAKAFWRNKTLSKNRKIKLSKCGYTPDWQYHLQQMVLEKEPLKYLEKFL